MAKKDKVQEATESTETETTTEAPVLSEKDIAIRAAFDDNQGSEEEVVKMAMLQAGCKIKAVARTYNTFMIDAGFMATNDEKNDSLEASLPGMDLTSEDGFEAAVAAIKSDVKGATDKSAAAMVRAWAKKAEVEVYKKPAGASRTDTLTYKFFKWIRENPAATKADVSAFVKEHGTENTNEGIFQRVRETTNFIVDPDSVSEAA